MFLAKKENGHATFFPRLQPVLRRYAQSMSGRSSSQVTWPPVAFSISGQRSAGTLLFGDAHFETACTDTGGLKALAILARPTRSMAFCIGVMFMKNIQPQVDKYFNYKFNSGLLQPNCIGWHDGIMEIPILGRRIKERLRAIGKTQAWLAVELGLSDEAVSKWVKGKGDPTLGNLRAMATLLGCSIGYLAGDEQNDDVAAITEMSRHMNTEARRYYRKAGASFSEQEDTKNKKAK